MSGSFKGCCSSQRRKIKLFLQQLVKTCTFKRIGKASQRNRLWSNFDFLTSSFSMMEVSNQFRKIFNVIDANGDGKISSLELSEILCFGYDKSKATKEAEGMLKHMDYNGDGFVDFDEFVDAVQGSDSKQDYLMDAFLIFDTDKNGFISATELRRVLINLGCDKCSVKECRRMIKGVDKDGDGFVDFEEFRSMMTDNSTQHSN